MNLYIPKSFSVGEVVSWTESDLETDYPYGTHGAAAWELVNDTGTLLFTAAAGQVFTADLTTAAAGVYTAILSVGTSFIARIVVEVYGVTGDLRTIDRQCLDNIEAVLANKASADNLSYQIAGRALQKYSWDELIRMREYFEGRVTAEDVTARTGSPTRSNKIVTIFKNI